MLTKAKIKRFLLTLFPTIVFFQLALAVLHFHLRLRVLHPVGQALAVGHPPLLVRLPAPRRRQGRVVVLHGRARLLLVARHITVLRRQEEGLLVRRRITQQS